MYDLGWTRNQSAIGTATTAAAPTATQTSRMPSGCARPMPITIAAPTTAARSAPDGCAYAHAASAAAATASDRCEPVSAKRVMAYNESASGGMIQTPSAAPLLAA